MKKIHFLSYLLMILFIVGCNSQSNDESSNEHVKDDILYQADGKTVRYKGETVGGIPEGKGIEYFPSGTVKFEGTFKDGEIYEGTAYRGGEVYYKGLFKDEMPFQDGVSSQEELRAKTDKENYLNGLSDETPVIGMTKEEVVMTSWGKPEDVNRTVTTYGTREQWVYSNYRYLYFEDGILTVIQE